LSAAARTAAIALDAPGGARRVPVRARGGRRSIGVWGGLAFACVLAAARYLDVTDDGPAMLLFGTAYTASLAAAALLRPQWFPPLAVAYLPFCGVYPLLFGGVPGANLTNLLVLLGPVACIVSRSQRRERARFGGVERLLAAYIAFAAFSMLPAYAAGEGPVDVVQTFRAWVAPILFFFYTALIVRDRREAGGVLEVLAWTTILVAGLTWWEGIERGGRSTIEASRVSGLMEQPNSMGAFLVYYGVALLAFALTVRPWPRRALYLAGFAAAARAMLFTFSRGAYLAMAAGAAVVLLLRSPLLLGVAGGAGAAAAVAFPGLMPDSVAARLRATMSEDDAFYDADASQALDRSSAHRLVLWRGAAGMIRDHPLTGVGIGQFQRVIGYYTEVPLREGEPRDAHNAFILIAAEMGVPTLLLLLSLHATFALVAIRVYRRRRTPLDRGLAVAFLGMEAGVLVSCMLGSRFSDESLIGYYWILAALLLITSRFPEVPVRRRRRAWR
jgi:O-antigen ligase